MYRRIFAGFKLMRNFSAFLWDGRSYKGLRYRWRDFAVMSALIVFCLMSALQAQAGQTLDDAVTTQLIDTCDILNGSDGAGALSFYGAQLFELCGGGGPTGGGGFSAGAGAGTTFAKRNDIRQIVQSRREEGSPAVAGKRVRLAALGNTALVGNAADLSSGLGLFIAGNYERVDRDQTTFEAGYESKNWGLTVGADHRFTDWLIAGLALDLNRVDGDIESGGDFDDDSYGVIAYGSVFSDGGLFVDVTLGYSRSDYEWTRFAEWFSDPPQGPVRGFNKGSYDGDEYVATMLAGYDYRANRYTITPRAGFRYSYQRYDGYREESSSLVANTNFDIVLGGPTGLELALDDDTRRSLQSILGVNATRDFRVGGNIIVPHLFFDWLHEYKDDQRRVGVRFVQDNRPDPQRFAFNYDSPDRDFFYLGGGISAAFDNGFQPFASVHMLLGHEFYDSTLVFVGLRKVF